MRGIDDDEDDGYVQNNNLLRGVIKYATIKEESE